MRTLFQRVVVAIVSTIVVATAGALGGYVLGHAYALRQTESRLDQYANRVLLETIASTSESRAMLETMNGSPYQLCSDAEIEYFRQLIFQSQYLKAAGRMRNGQIECSTTSGRNPLAVTRYSPVMARQDGTRIYKNLAPFRVDDQSVVAVQLGESFIVYNPYNFASLAAPPMHFTATAIDAPRHRMGQMIGDSPIVPENILTREVKANVGNTLYATRCAKDSSGCLTAYISMNDALAMNRKYSMVFIGLGAAFGAIFGLLCPMLYSRNKSVEQQLIRAIRADALSVVYQPIVELSTGQIVEAEALVRWTDEYKNNVSPDVFVKIAEEKGFVGEITRLVLRHALRDFGATLRARPSFRININIAAADLADSEFIPMLDKQLNEAEVSPRNLGVEITESYTARQQVARNTILRLRQRGHYVAIDDFGTGYSSLAYLHDLSVDAIKIDKAFTKAIGTDAVTVSILPQILTMAETLGLRVVVEGIETKIQADYFAASDQDIHAQGWLFGRPVPARVFLQMLDEEEARLTKQAEEEFPSGAIVVTS
ncbi:EAL domain-containing protein [Occallatibacter savannae]|uniref:EAL domain-containing protein n=1 Tax=Occallatibacter savannae TaxID=1002691 RepID=UPI000D68DE6B|nr:EAL domain-containing protein [Occallatibacter savannae]